MPEEKKTWEEGSYLRQRRNLNALSIAMIIYGFAGGTVGRPEDKGVDAGCDAVSNGATAQLPGGLMAIQLEYPWVVIWFCWLALVYFVWRFFLVTRQLRETVIFERRVAYNDTRYIQEKKYEFSAPYELSDAGVTDYLRSINVNWSHTKLIINGGTHTRTGGTATKMGDEELPFWGFMLHAWWAEVKAARTVPEFSEYYTPFLLAWVAMVGGMVFGGGEFFGKLIVGLIL